jgi:hypothetical protein
MVVARLGHAAAPVQAGIDAIVVNDSLHLHIDTSPTEREVGLPSLFVLFVRLISSSVCPTGHWVLNLAP